MPDLTRAPLYHVMLLALLRKPCKGLGRVVAALLKVAGLQV